MQIDIERHPWRVQIDNRHWHFSHAFGAITHGWQAAQGLIGFDLFNMGQRLDDEQKGDMLRSALRWQDEEWQKVRRRFEAAA